MSKNRRHSLRALCGIAGLVVRTGSMASARDAGDALARGFQNPPDSAKPDAVKKYTHTSQQFYGANAPLLPSGLLGPVRVVRKEG